MSRLRERTRVHNGIRVHRAAAHAGRRTHRARGSGFRPIRARRRDGARGTHENRPDQPQPVVLGARRGSAPPWPVRRSKRASFRGCIGRRRGGGDGRGQFVGGPVGWGQPQWRWVGAATRIQRGRYSSGRAFLGAQDICTSTRSMGPSRTRRQSYAVCDPSACRLARLPPKPCRASASCPSSPPARPPLLRCSSSPIGGDRASSVSRATLPTTWR